MLTLIFAVLLSADPIGLAAFRDAQFTAAEGAFRTALRKKPSDALTRVWLARTLLELNRSPEAIVQLEQALQEPVTPDVRFEAGRLLRELAERRLAQLQASAPDDPATLELAGERLEWLGDLDGALKEYKAAAAKDSTRPGVHYRIGNILWLQRQTDPALTELRDELSLTPQHGMANLRVGQLLLQSDQGMESIRYFERALEAMPESVEAHREAGKAYRKVGRTAEARSHWERVEKARPNDNQIHYLLGNLYRELGETARATTELERHRSLLQQGASRPR